ncbi:MAG: glycosyltransferase family 2 protein [Nitrospirales bacterium]
MPRDQVDLSVVIVSYNTRAILLDCVSSIYHATRDVTFEIVVIDNGSHDGSAAAIREQCPAVIVIVNPDNRGFARAANQGLAASRGRYVLFLNSDTRVLNGSLNHMVAYLDQHPDVGALGCLQKTGEGRPYRSWWPVPTLLEHIRYAEVGGLPLYDGGSDGTPDPDQWQRPQEVGWVNGACLMLPAPLLRKLGGLDERFFMYFEDVDLCLRVRAAGYKVFYLPDAGIIHLVGASSRDVADSLNLEWELSRVLFVEKHFALIHRTLMKLWILGGAVGRLARGLMRASAAGRRRRLLRHHWTSISRVLGLG